MNVFYNKRVHGESFPTTPEIKFLFAPPLPKKRNTAGTLGSNTRYFREDRF